MKVYKLVVLATMILIAAGCASKEEQKPQNDEPQGTSFEIKKFEVSHNSLTLHSSEAYDIEVTWNVDGAFSCELKRTQPEEVWHLENFENGTKNVEITEETLIELTCYRDEKSLGLAERIEVVNTDKPQISQFEVSEKHVELRGVDGKDIEVHWSSLNTVNCLLNDSTTNETVEVEPEGDSIVTVTSDRTLTLTCKDDEYNSVSKSVTITTMHLEKGNQICGYLIVDPRNSDKAKVYDRIDGTVLDELKRDVLLSQTHPGIMNGFYIVNYPREYTSSFKIRPEDVLVTCDPDEEVRKGFYIHRDTTFRPSLSDSSSGIQLKRGDFINSVKWETVQYGIGIFYKIETEELLPGSSSKTGYLYSLATTPETVYFGYPTKGVRRYAKILANAPEVTSFTTDSSAVVITGDDQASVNLSWSSKNAESCSITRKNPEKIWNNLKANGTLQVNIGADTELSIICMGINKRGSKKSLEITATSTLPKIISFSPSRSSVEIDEGGSREIRLSWRSINTSNCTITREMPFNTWEQQDSSDSLIVEISETTDISLKCSNDAGKNVVKSITINTSVSGPRIEDFNVDKRRVQLDENDRATVLVSWNVFNAERCVLTRSQPLQVWKDLTENSIRVEITEKTRLLLECNNAEGETDYEYLNVYVTLLKPEIDSFLGDTYRVTLGIDNSASVTFRWESSNSKQCDLTRANPEQVWSGLASSGELTIPVSERTDVSLTCRLNGREISRSYNVRTEIGKPAITSFQSSTIELVSSSEPQHTELTWESENAKHCKIKKSNSEQTWNVDAKGLLTNIEVNSATTFELQCFRDQFETVIRTIEIKQQEASRCNIQGRYITIDGKKAFEINELSQGLEQLQKAGACLKHRGGISRADNNYILIDGKRAFRITNDQSRLEMFLLLVKSGAFQFHRGGISANDSSYILIDGKRAFNLHNDQERAKLFAELAASGAFSNHRGGVSKADSQYILVDGKRAFRIASDEKRANLFAGIFKAGGFSEKSACKFENNAVEIPGQSPLQLENGENGVLDFYEILDSGVCFQ